MSRPILAPLLSNNADSELVARLRRGEPEALGDLYDQFGQLAFDLICQIVRDPSVAEELLAETFIKAWNRVQKFDSPSAGLGFWVLALARNRAIEYLRCSAREKRANTTVRLAALEQPQLFLSFCHEDHRADRVRRMREMLSKLTDCEQGALELAYFKGFSKNEIAAKLQQPAAVVENWVRAAIEKLRAGGGQSQPISTT